MENCVKTFVFYRLLLFVLVCFYFITESIRAFKFESCLTALVSRFCFMEKRPLFSSMDDNVASESTEVNSSTTSEML